MAGLRALRSPAVGSHQYFYELRHQFAQITDYLYLCSNNAVQQTSKLKRLKATAEVVHGQAYPIRKKYLSALMFCHFGYLRVCQQSPHVIVVFIVR